MKQESGLGRLSSVALLGSEREASLGQDRQGSRERRDRPKQGLFSHRDTKFEILPSKNSLTAPRRENEDNPSHGL